ncbi:hypothetical protein [Hydrogenophaga crocea]|uniref:Transmembrane protein n=1 Tax=Hydrogenophaga crocea TaxID=2716225 RepID=A0A6G8IC53_9BURK|nr:hypothetical protein [Hydrogenophaga crocea]QIM50757.1 hypothetical protein G9Q37_00730 [Hydrogenophaga crocea]
MSEDPIEAALSRLARDCRSLEEFKARVIASYGQAQLNHALSIAKHLGRFESMSTVQGTASSGENQSPSAISQEGVAVQIRSFFLGATKIAVAIVVSFVVLAALAFGVWKVFDAQRIKEEESQAVLREWTSQTKSFLGFDVSAKTKWLDSRVYVSVHLSDAPHYMVDAPLREENLGRGIFVQFTDADGFKVFEHLVKLSDLSRNVDNEGKAIGFETQFDEFMPIDAYKRVQGFTVRWNLITKMSQPAPEPREPPRPEQAGADHCAPGLTRAERLKRLSRFGQVRETGLGEYSAGARSVTFLSTGELLNCR